MQIHHSLDIPPLLIAREECVCVCVCVCVCSRVAFIDPCVELKTSGLYGQIENKQTNTLIRINVL